MRMPGARFFDNLPSSVHSFVRDDTAPVEGFDDIFLGPGYEPVGVCVFYPYDEVSAFLLGIKVII